MWPGRRARWSRRRRGRSRWIAVVIDENPAGRSPEGLPDATFFDVDAKVREVMGMFAVIEGGRG